MVSAAAAVAVLGLARMPVAAQPAKNAVATPTPTPKPCPTPIATVNVVLGLGLRVAKADCSIVIVYPPPATPSPAATAAFAAPSATATPVPTPVPPDRINVTVFATPGATLKMTYTMFVASDSNGKAIDSLAVTLATGEQAGPALDRAAFQATPVVSYRVYPDGTCDATIGTCTVSKATLATDRATKLVRWSGTMTADFGRTPIVGRNDCVPDSRRSIDPKCSEHLVRYLEVRLARTNATLPAGRNVAEPVRILVTFDPRSDVYTPKPNADTKKIRDGIAAFMRSRLGFDAAQNWSTIFRASAGVGQSATDQAAGAKRAGDDLLDPSKSADVSKDGFATTDADVFAFPDIAAAASRLALRPDALKKDLGDAGAAVTPFSLSNIIAPDAAFKLVMRNDGGPGPSWRLGGGLLFDAANGDDPASVHDAAAVLTAKRTSANATTSISALYAVANRVQTSTDFINGPFVAVASGGGVTRYVAVPSPRPVHVVNEGLQIADDRAIGFSTFLRATVEPLRAGSDVFVAERWSGMTSSTRADDSLRSRVNRYAAVAGWRSSGNDFIAPLGSRVDLSGTRGPFYMLSYGSLSVAPDFRRESALTFYQSRWSDAHAQQQYTSRLDALVDFWNRLGLTGTGTLSAASLELLTRESSHIPLPLREAPLVPQRQGSIGLSWRPPNGEFSLSRGYAFLTDCQNIAATSFAPQGLPKNTVVPACAPVGRATFTGSGRVTSGNFSAAFSYGGPTAVERTPLLGGAIQRAAALRYTFGCNVLQAAYTNRGGYDGLTDVAGSTYGASLELHNLIRTHGSLLGERRVIVTLSYAGSTKIPLGAPAQSKTAFNPSPDVLHTADANGC